MFHIYQLVFYMDLFIFSNYFLIFLLFKLLFAFNERHETPVVPSQITRSVWTPVLETLV